MSSEAIVYVMECDSCKKPMGGVTQDELNYLAREMGDGLCFDCDASAADGTPEIFMGLVNGEKLRLGGLELEVYGDVLEFSSVVQSHAHERTRARVLSSYTKVNGARHKLATLEQLVEYELCPECHGQSFFVGAYGGESCGFCGDFGSIPVLAVWVRFLISGGVSNE